MKKDKEFNDISSEDKPDNLSGNEFETACDNMYRDYFSKTLISKNNKPKLLYITGLSGSGKSTFIKEEQNIISDINSYTHINFDDLRIYHPRYKEHVIHEPLNAAAKTDYAVYNMIKWLSAEGIKLNIDIMLDDTAMGSEMTLEILAPFKENGYEINVFAISVPQDISRQSVLLRFEEDLKIYQNDKSVLPRWVNTTEQDSSPTRLIETIKTLEVDKKINSVTIIDRDNKVIQTSKPSETIKNDLVRDLTDNEKLVFQKNQNRINALKKQSGGFSASPNQ